MNTIDPEYFIANIKEGYRLRKERHSDKGMASLEVDQGMYALLMGSNQIIQNRGRALAYLSGLKKRGNPDNSMVDEEAKSDKRSNAERKKPHEFKRTATLNPQTSKPQVVSAINSMHRGVPASLSGTMNNGTRSVGHQH